MEMKWFRLRTILMCAKPYLGRCSFKRLTPSRQQPKQRQNALPLVNFEDALRPVLEKFSKEKRVRSFLRIRLGNRHGLRALQGVEAPMPRQDTLWTM